ncbi:unnamed protein product, partial [Iphiclides podalirius]
MDVIFPNRQISSPDDAEESAALRLLCSTRARRVEGPRSTADVGCENKSGAFGAKVFDGVFGDTKWRLVYRTT